MEEVGKLQRWASLREALEYNENNHAGEGITFPTKEPFIKDEQKRGHRLVTPRPLSYPLIAHLEQLAIIGVGAGVIVVEQNESTSRRHELFFLKWF